MEYTTKKYIEEWKHYIASKGETPPSDGISYMSRFTWGLIAKAMNELCKLQKRALWIIVYHEDGIALKLTNFNEKQFKEAYDLATNKYWNFNQKHYAIKYMLKLANNFVNELDGGPMHCYGIADKTGVLD